MSSKKHLGRRNTRRRAIHLSEFLRGDEEPPVQVSSQENVSQNSNISSIGSIPPPGLTASAISVSPVLTPSDNQEKEPRPPLASPPPPVNVWKLSPGKNDRPADAFMPDKQEYPELGKQLSKAKPEAKKAIKSLDSAAQGAVLSSILPGSMQPEGTSGKGQAVTCWLSSVRSVSSVDDNTQDTRQQSSAKKITLLKTGSAQKHQQPSLGFALEKQPQINPYKPASTASESAPSQRQQQQRLGGNSQMQPEITPDKPASTASKRGSAQKQQQQQPSLGDALDKKSQISPKNQASTASVRAPSQQLQPSLGGALEKSQITPKKPPSTVSERAPFQQQQQQPQRQSQQQQPTKPQNKSPGSRQSQPRPAEQTKPMQPPTGLPLAQLQNYEEDDVVADSQVSPPSLNCSTSFWEEDDELYPVMEAVAPERAGNQVQAREQEQVLPVQPWQDHQPLVPPVRRSTLNANAQEFHPRSREQLGLAGGSAQLSQQQQQPQPQPDEDFFRRRARLSRRRRMQRMRRSMREEEELESQEAALAAYPTCYYSAPAQYPQAMQAMPPPVAAAASFEQNAYSGQSVFRLASLPSTGVGTMPSSIRMSSTTPSSLSTLSSAAGELNWSQDLVYTRPHLDMDREEEETQPEVEPAQNQQCPWQMDTALEEDAEADIVMPLFQSPQKHAKGYPQPDLNCVPGSIRTLHSMITQAYSDFSFVYALSAQLGQECVPMDCYVYLKMALLASIVSIEPDELRPPISLCIIATDSLMANRLMNTIGQLAPRFLGPHEYGLQPTIGTGGGQLSSRYQWVVASPLLLAQQGVYYAGDWTRLSKEHSEQIEKCIENGAVPVPQLQSDQALEAAIWTHWQPENATNQTLAFAKLCPIFGLPIYMGDGKVSESLYTFLLRPHTKAGQSEDHQQDGLNIPEEDMRMLLHLLHQRKVTFEDRAQHMLQKYYVISRKERPTVFTSKTYIVLKQFAESFAKLALRLQVLESDVCVAIFHCEHFVQQIFGAQDATHSLPPPVVNSFRVISHIDPYMNEFARWLQQHLGRYEDNELGMHKAKRRRTDSWGLL